MGGVRVVVSLTTSCARSNVRGGVSFVSSPFCSESNRSFFDFSVELSSLEMSSDS